jgi:DNA-binding CsgD family transcriptional regulator
MRTLSDYPNSRSWVFDKLLSPSEIEVWRYIALGLGRKDIAQRRGTSVKTIDSQKDLLRRKLQVRGPADLTRLAVRFGLIAVEVLPQ